MPDKTKYHCSTYIYNSWCSHNNTYSWNLAGPRRHKTGYKKYLDGGKFGTTSTPVTDSWVSSVRHPYRPVPYRTHPRVYFFSFRSFQGFSPLWRTAPRYVCVFFCITRYGSARFFVVNSHTVQVRCGFHFWKFRRWRAVRCGAGRALRSILLENCTVRCGAVMWLTVVCFLRRSWVCIVVDKPLYLPYIGLTVAAPYQKRTVGDFLPNVKEILYIHCTGILQLWRFISYQLDYRPSQRWHGR